MRQTHTHTHIDRETETNRENLCAFLQMFLLDHSQLLKNRFLQCLKGLAHALYY